MLSIHPIIYGLQDRFIDNRNAMETPMLQLKPLDQNVPIFQQLSTDVSPVVLVNVFQVAEADIPALLKAWEADANWMKRQPGYISTRPPGASG